MRKGHHRAQPLSTLGLRDGVDVLRPKPCSGKWFDHGTVVRVY